MSGQRRTNWRTEMDAIVAAEAEARVATVRALLNEITDLSRSLTTACQDAAELRDHLGKLERSRANHFLAIVFIGIGVLIAAVIR